MTAFIDRHTGIQDGEVTEMLQSMGYTSIEELMAATIPEHIRHEATGEGIPDALSEHDMLAHMRHLADMQPVRQSLIGQGYYGTITPSVIQRCVLENPGWYTQYTPYQAEISQGRLEALINFQTVITELTGFEVSNASLLDEGTAAAEAMLLAFHQRNKRIKDEDSQIRRFLVDDQVYPHTLDVLNTRASSMGIELVYGDITSASIDETCFGMLLQYPGRRGDVTIGQDLIDLAKSHDLFVIMAADPISLTLLPSPASMGADIAIGSTQRLGIPMGAGGPHAAYFACPEKYKRVIPGRIIGISKDRFGQPTYRMALQTREQHIKREKATSNICTAQALLAIMASFYAVYHGPRGMREIAFRIHKYATQLHHALSAAGIEVINSTYFDTISVRMSTDEMAKVRKRSLAAGINLFYSEEGVQCSIDETCTDRTLVDLLDIFDVRPVSGIKAATPGIPEVRPMDYLGQAIFNSLHDETSLMRYIKSLENKDLSLVHSMIPLGSCTMKLNAATELLPLTWPAFSTVHPFSPVDQQAGYRIMIDELERYLAITTGFTATSVMPNSGAQGEFTGLKIIQAYHQDRGDTSRDITVIPSSAHGTNPASAVMAGMKVVVTPCDEEGNIIVEALKDICTKMPERIAALMITYPSTHGVFESSIKEIIQLIHDAGGLVYMDGANMNAQIGYSSPGHLGADVCHLNLHKTFAIPHGGGGPGVGPICCNDKLAPYLPRHRYVQTGGDEGIEAVSSAPFGSASILMISYAYIRMLGWQGMKRCTEVAILNANYLMDQLDEDYAILYRGYGGRCAHEFIIDLRPFKTLGIQAEDVAKRLIDYGFHAPTMSFPVPGTIMIEPTESENLRELDRFVFAMRSIKKEIEEVASGEADAEDNVLRNAPHPVSEVTADDWSHSYSRQKAAYPVSSLYGHQKFWTTVGRVDNAYGDRNLVCTCPPISDYIATHEMLASE